MPPIDKTVRTVLYAQSLAKKTSRCIRTDVWASGAERAWQVKEGQAVAYVAYSKAYVDEEESAAAAKKGVWSAKGFQKPWDYRKARKEEGRVRLCRSYDHYTRSHDCYTRACCAWSAMLSGGRGFR